MKIAVGSDHAGFKLRNSVTKSIKALGHEVIDCGTRNEDSVDYPDFAQAVGQKINSGEAELGVLICSTGIGISIAANKIKGIRAALVHNEDGAKYSRSHNKANVLCFGQKYISPEDAEKFVRIFLSTPFDGDRHQRRVDKISALENC